VLAAGQWANNGDYRFNGTYMQPYLRSTPNNTLLDNFSTRGNVDPYRQRQSGLRLAVSVGDLRNAEPVVVQYRAV